MTAVISSDIEFADFSESHEVKSLLVYLPAALWTLLIVKALESHFPAAVYVSSS